MIETFAVFERLDSSAHAVEWVAVVVGSPADQPTKTVVAAAVAVVAVVVVVVGLVVVAAELVLLL